MNKRTILISIITVLTTILAMLLILHIHNKRESDTITSDFISESDVDEDEDTDTSNVNIQHDIKYQNEKQNEYIHKQDVVCETEDDIVPYLESKYTDFEETVSYVSDVTGYKNITYTASDAEGNTYTIIFVVADDGIHVTESMDMSNTDDESN